MNNGGKRGEGGWRARKLRQGEGNACCKVRRNCNISQHDATHGCTYYYICHDYASTHVFFQPSSVFYREPPNIVPNNPGPIRETSPAINRNQKSKPEPKRLCLRGSRSIGNSAFYLSTQRMFTLACFTFILACLSLREIILPLLLHSPLFFYVQENCI